MSEVVEGGSGEEDVLGEGDVGEGVGEVVSGDESGDVDALSEEGVVDGDDGESESGELGGLFGDAGEGGSDEGSAGEGGVGVAGELEASAADASSEVAPVVEEGTGHADAVFPLGEAVVAVGGGDACAGAEVELVGGEDDGCAALFAGKSLPAVELSDDGACFVGGVGAHAWVVDTVVGVEGGADGDDADGADVGVIEEVGDGAVEVLAVVDAWAEDDLGMCVDAPVVELSELGLDIGSAGVAE